MFVRNRFALASNRFAAFWIFGFWLTVSLCTGQPPLDQLEQQAFQEAANFAQQSVVQVETFGGLEIVNQQVQSTGPSSGTILTADGWIVTSTFQFRGQPASITVLLPDEQRKAAKLVARDYSRELALLKIDTDTPLKPAIPSDRSDWQVGQWVLALGKTFDVKISSRSVGILSATERIWNKAIQTDAKVSPQNYGGPLVDLNGRIMGVLTPMNPGIMTEGEVEQWYDSGIGFAVPLQDILERLPRLQQGEDIYPGKAGIRSRRTDEFAKPIVLAGVTPGSPAAKAGLRSGDEVIAAGPDSNRLRKVEMHSQLKHVLGPIDAGQPLTLEVKREEQTHQFSLTLMKELPVYREPYFGIVLDPSSPVEAPKVAVVLPDSPAARAGIRAGEVLEKVNSEPMHEQRTLESNIVFSDYREPMRFNIQAVDGVSRELMIPMDVWPDKDLEWEAIPVPPAVGPNDATAAARGTIQLPLGDVKNKAFAIVPSTYAEGTAHGLLLVFGEPGVQDQKLWTDAWELFAREHRWIVVVVQSADDKRWQREEVEIADRLRAYMLLTYSIDRRRVCIGGIASGSLVALSATLQSMDQYRGIWISNLKVDPRVLAMPPAEPLKSIHFFVTGTDPSVKALSDLVGKNAYPVVTNSMDWPMQTMNESVLMPRLQRWLRLLEAY